MTETFATPTRAATGRTAATKTVGAAIPQTPLFTALRLQEIPIVGPRVVTPIVTAVNRVPIVGDLLHPIFGYPLLPDGFVAPRDVRVVSFDGTRINVHVLPAAGLLDGQTAPTVLWGSPLGMPGATSINGTPVDPLFTDFGGMISVAALRQAGYNVVTWDPRGTFFSGGLLQADSPDFEARDVSTIINWVATLPEVQLDGPGDPRIGMVGGSYGGAIQPVTTAADHRVEAIVPALAWNTLNSSYYPNNAFKSSQGFALASTLILTLTRTDPRILASLLIGALTGRITPGIQDFFAQRGPGSARGFPDLVADITAPTLLIQGTVDPAFGLAQADITATTLLGQGVPTKVIWFCGGHSLCSGNLFDPAEGALIEQRTLDWLDRYVKQEAVTTGPGFEWFDQLGQHLSTETYGPPPGEPIVASDSTNHLLPLIPVVGGSGVPVLPVKVTKALNAVNLATPAATTTTYIAGEPQLTLSYSGVGVGGHVYAQLVDTTNRSVLGSQATPVPVTLDGQTHTVSIALQPLAYTLRPGDTLILQLFAWSADYAANPALGRLTVTGLEISLPTAVDVTVAPAAPPAV